MSKENAKDEEEEDEYEEEEEEEEEQDFRFFSNSELPKIVKKEIDETKDFLFLPADSALALLIHMKWSKERLNEKYFEHADTLKEWAGIKPDAISLTLPSDSIIDAKKNDFLCDICCETKPLSEYYALVCKHGYCKGCLGDNIEYRMLNEGVASIETRCAKAKCNVVYPISFVRQVLNDKSFSRYEFFIHKSFLNNQKNLRLCPAPNCVWMAKRSLGSFASEVKCRCGYVYCFGCTRLSHSPVPCLYMNKWEDKLSGNDLWLATHTQKCPKCRIDIEKNLGCNHMTCRSCHHEFCWMCDGDWRIHGSQTGGFYSCNRPKTVIALDTGDPFEYFKFYYKRFSGHEKSLEYAEKQRATIIPKQNEYMALIPGRLREDAAFIEDAIEFIVDCRRLLRCSFILGFYLRSGPQKVRFEFQQENIEAYTEALTELTEKVKGDQMNKEKIEQYTKGVKQFVQNIRAYYCTEALDLCDR